MFDKVLNTPLTQQNFLSQFYVTNDLKKLIQ